MATFMATLRTRRSATILRLLTPALALCLAWLEVSPAYAAEANMRHEDARRNAWAADHQPKLFLPPSLPQTTEAALRAKINTKQTAKPVADVRPLTPSEMAHASGRGPYRNAVLCGTLPWQRSFRDVNMCNGNLFKSFSDMQVAPARGAGLVLQRTYNSNDSRVGPFGVGWTHAYDIRMQEDASVQAEEGSTNSTTDQVDRTDFFGAKHQYHRDADGLYTPPSYLYDTAGGDYDKAGKVIVDTETGEDGTVKHYTNVLTLANGTPGQERACDSITDRHGNQTVLTYGQSTVQADGSTRRLLTQVTDPSGRSLVFTWSNLNASDSQHPAWRITQVQGPFSSGQTVPDVTYRVTYSYYLDANSPNAANELYNLKSVTLDPDNLSRTTTFSYTSYSGPKGVENALLAFITDPLGHVVSYQYSTGCPAGDGYNPYTVPDGPYGTVYVSKLSEPASGGSHNWMFRWDMLSWGFNFFGSSQTQCIVSDHVDSTTGSSTDDYSPDGLVNRVEVCSDNRQRADLVSNGLAERYYNQYDSDNNVITKVQTQTVLDGFGYGDDPSQYSADAVNQKLNYGSHGNLLTQTFAGFPGTTVYTYYNADKYFQKQSVTDANGHTTTMDYYDAQDAFPGNRGEVKWVRDAGYADSTSPSFQKQFTYSYNSYGQKTSETNLSGATTQYSYGTNGDPWGNLTQVVQDPGGTGHLNRMTSMIYDAAGRVLQSTDPLRQQSTFAYNDLGQPQSVHTPARGNTAAENIIYGYGGNGRTESVQDNRGPTTISYENGTDQVSSVSDPVTGTIGYTYYICGARKTMTLSDGNTWHYRYSLADGQAALGSDQPDSVAQSLGEIIDDQGHIVEFMHEAPGMYNVLQMRRARSNESFDSQGNLASYQEISYYVDGRASTFSIDGSTGAITEQHGSYTHNWITSVRDTWSWRDATGSWHQRLIMGNDYTYDNTGQRLTNLITTAATNSDGTLKYDGGTPQYTSNTLRDDWGQTTVTYDTVTNQTLNTRLEKYQKADGSSGYDGLNRLTDVDYGDGETQHYAFDSMGNRLSKADSVTAGGTTTTTTTASTYDLANRLLSTAQNGGSASAVTSDADGNTLTDTSGRTMTWDSQNRMASCTKNGVTSTYTYGADGLRRSSTVGGVTTYYVYDGQTMIREMKKNAQTGALFNTATYLQGLRGGECRIDETQQTEGYYDLTTHQLNGRGVAKWYIYDSLGSVVGEIDASGSLTSSPKYDVYGAVRGNAGTASTRQGFVGGLGHVSDAETGLVYMRARYYDPSNGRFMSQDPAAHGLNWFIYASNSPVNRVDPTGREDMVDLEVSMDGQAELSGNTGLAELNAQVEVEGENANVWVGMIRSSASGLRGGGIKLGDILSATRSWAMQNSITQITIQGLTTTSGESYAGKVVAAIVSMGDKGELDQDGYLTTIYWLLQNG